MADATAVASTEVHGLVLLSGTCTLNPGSLATGAREEQTISVPGAHVGDAVLVTPPADLGAGMLITPARVKSAGVISFYLENTSAGTVDVASGSWGWSVIRGQIGVSSAG